jgi:hypothetical protein
MNDTWKDKAKHLSKGGMLVWYEDIVFLKDGKVYRQGRDHDGPYCVSLPFSEIKSTLQSEAYIIV